MRDTWPLYIRSLGMSTPQIKRGGSGKAEGKEFQRVCGGKLRYDQEAV